VLIFGDGKILSSYVAYYNEVRTHLSPGKDAPAGRAVQRSGAIVAIPILSGLHHHYGKDTDEIFGKDTYTED